MMSLIHWIRVARKSPGYCLMESEFQGRCCLALHPRNAKISGSGNVAVNHDLSDASSVVTAFLTPAGHVLWDSREVKRLSGIPLDCWSLQEARHQDGSMASVNRVNHRGSLDHIASHGQLIPNRG